MSSYKVIIEECEEGGYYAECPAFQGCYVEDDNYEEIIVEIKQAIQAFMFPYSDSHS